MNFIAESFKQAFYLILNLDREAINIVILSLKVSGGALIFATIAGLPLRAFVGLKNFKGRPVIITILNTLIHSWGFHLL